jgi:S-layer protein
LKSISRRYTTMAFITAETRSSIVELAMGMLNQAPSTKLLNTLIAKSVEGASIQDLADYIATTDAFTAEYPATQTAREFATEMFGKLITGGTLDADINTAVIDLLEGLLIAGTTKAEGFVAVIDFLANPANAEHPDLGDIAQSFQNRADAAEYFSVTKELGDSTDAELAAAIASVTSDADTLEAANAAADSTADAEEVVAGQTFTLTTGVDKVVGGGSDDTIKATGATLGALDTVNGGEGTDTLSITDTTGASEAGLKGTISNVETLSLSGEGGMGAAAVAAVAAGTNTAAVAQAKGLVATGSYAATDVVTLSIGSYTKDITIGAIGVADQSGRKELMDQVKAEIEAVLGDAVTVSAVGTDTGTGGTPSTFLQTAITVTSKVPGTVLPSITVADKTVASASTGAVATAAATSAQTADKAAVTVTANKVATASAAAKEVKQLVISDAGGGAAAYIGSYKVTIGDSIYTGDAAAPGDAVATTPATIAADLVRIINSAMGATVAVQGGTAAAPTGTITITAPNAGTALPLLSVDYVTVTGQTMVKPAEAYSTLVTNTATNSAGSAAVAAVVYNASGFDTVNASVEGDINTKLGAAATASLATTDGSATVSGGADVTVTATEAVTVSGTTLAVASVTTGTTSAAVNIGATGATATTVTPTLTTATVKGGSDVLVADYAKGVSSGTLTSVTVGGTKDATVTLAGKALTNLTVSSQSVATDITIDSTGATADHTLTLTLSGAGASSLTAPKVVEITDARAEAINITTAKASNVKIDGDSGLTLVTAAGAGALEINLDGANNGIKTFDGSSATGGITITNLSASTKAVTTGAGADKLTTSSVAAFDLATNGGADVVTIGTTTAAGTSITLGDGNDILLKGAGSVAIDSAGDVTSIDGGAGDNVLDNRLVNAGNADQFTNFNTLGLGLTTGTFDSSLVSGISSLHLLATGGTYTGVTPSMSMAIDKNTTAGTAVTTLTFATGTASGTADSYSVAITPTQTSATAKATSLQSIDSGTLKVEGIENVTIASNAVGYVNNVVDLTSATLQTVTVTGSAPGMTLGFAGTNGTNVTAALGGAVNLIDATGYAGDLSVNTSNVTADSRAAVGLTVATGAGDDVITLAGSAKVSAGAGDDKIVTAASAVSVMTGGAGNDHFDVQLSVGATGGAVIADLESSDIIEVAGAYAAAGTLGDNKDIGAATSLAEALEIANGATGGVAADQVVWFQYAGNTYLYADLSDGANRGTLDANDNIVQIVGLVELEGSTYTTAGVLTVI